MSLQKMELKKNSRSRCFMDRLEKKAREEADRRCRVASNPLYRLACIVGIL